MLREMKNTGIKWIGDIPNNWNVLDNKYVFDISKKLIIGSPENYQLLSLTTKGIKEKNPDDLGGKVPENYNGYQIVEKNDIVMCLFDLDCSAVFSGITVFNGMISPAYKILKVNSSKKITEKYADYWFRFIGHDRLFKQFSKNLRYTIGSDEFQQLPIVVPPKDEQEKIVAFLDEKCEKIDKVTKKLEKQIEVLEEYKNSVITEAVTKGLNPSAPMKDSGIKWVGKIPEHWEIKKIGSVYNERRTKVSDKDYAPLSVTKKGVLPQLETVAKTDDGDNRKLVKRGDFAINSRSDRRGSCGISELDGSVSLINTVLEPRSNMDNVYYNYTFKTESFADEFYRWGHGIVADLWTTRWADMKNIYIPYPPMSEQKEIASFLNKKCKTISTLIAQKEKAIETLNEYKKSLIYEYVTGKKEVV